MTTIIGIDPGLSKMGVAILETNQAGAFQCIATYCIQTYNDAAIPARLSTLYNALSTIIEEHKPTACAVEGVLVNTNAVASMKLSYSFAVVALVMQHSKIAMTTYSPKTIKKAIVFNGNAKKDAIKIAVRQRATMAIDKNQKTQKATSNHEYDAIAAALCFVAELNPVTHIE